MYRASGSTVIMRGFDKMGGKKRMLSHMLLGLMALFCSLVSRSEAQPPGAFISIDCGSPTNYTDSLGIVWSTDDGYISTGHNAVVQPAASANLGPDGSQNVQKLRTIRYFPEVRSKHCYVIPEVQQNNVYLIRMMFLGANFTSAQNQTVSFGITVNNFYLDYITISNGSSPVIKEVSFTTSTSTFSLCLVQGVGIPFISSLELRLLPVWYYQTSGYPSLVLNKLFRWNCGTPPGTPSLRYPDDPYDRLWASDPPGLNVTWINNSSATFDTSLVRTPNKVLDSAWTAPRGGSINFSWPVPNGNLILTYAYFAEVTTRAKNSTRIVNGYVDDELLSDPIDVTSTPSQPFNFSIVSSPNNTTFSILPTSHSTLGPILNAIEVYNFSFYNSSFRTLDADVGAVAAIQKSFNLTDWTGDPCLPVAWDWLECSSPETTTISRVLRINLTAYNLSGTIPVDIELLTQLTDLSLQNNNLSGIIPNMTFPPTLQTLRLQNNQFVGPIPASLAALPDLTILTLDNNMLTGEVPPGLLSKIDDNSLMFSASGNPFLCFGANICLPVSTPSPSPANNGSGKSSSNIGIIIGAIAAVLVVLLVAGFLFCWVQRRAPKSSETSAGRAGGVIVDNQRQAKFFSLMEVKTATNNFAKSIGEGGFGLVYYGKLPDGQEVAVKVSKENVGNANKTDEFSNEVALLSRVHHRNLVSLVGYCDELGQQILLYAYMSEGTLQQHLYGENQLGTPLDWKTRLDIALNAATGIEYLHNSCSPAIIHRDIKSQNILLTDRLFAKVADFGISKITKNDGETRGVTTQIKGTHGYLDPEYFREHRLTPKSDVYSFGVVLLELATGQSPRAQTFPGGSASTLQDWVLDSVREGNIHAIVDPQLAGNYNLESMWKVVEMALLSLNREGVQRPEMLEIVRGLADAVQLQSSHIQPQLPEHSPSQLPASDFDRYQRVHNASRGSRGSRGSRSSNDSVATHSWGSNITAR